MAIVSDEVDLETLPSGTLIVTIPQYLILDEPGAKRVIENSITSNGSWPETRTLNDDHGEDGSVNWGEVGVYLGMRRLRIKIRKRKRARRGRKTGVTIESVMRPVFLIAGKQTILNAGQVRTFDDVPDWVIELAKSLR